MRNEMDYEVLSIDGVNPNLDRETIKSTVISIQNYRVRRELMPDMYHMYRVNIDAEEKIYMEKMAGQQAKHQLLDGLEQFVHCAINQEQNFVEAQIWMPYVRDELVRSLEETEERLTGHLVSRDGTIWHLQEVIKYLELPWWKKLWLKIKP